MNIELLVNPNIAYLILVLAVVSAVMAVLIPGTGLPELGTLLALSLSIYLASQLGVNYIGLVVLMLGLIFLTLTFFRRSNRLYLALAMLFLLLGSIFLYPGNPWYLPAVHPLLAIVASPLATIFLWLMGRKTVEAHLAPPVHNLQFLIGETGETTTWVHDTGTVQIASELWSARSQAEIPANTAIRVVGRDGFVLLIEKI